MRYNGSERIKILYPEEFASEYIYCYPSLNEELKDILEKSGEKGQFTRKYRRALEFLERLRRNCIYQKTFEKLRDVENLYSIRLLNGLNARILFSFFIWRDKEIVVLLYCFSEKSSARKKNPKSYAYAIEMAKKRIEYLTNTYFLKILP